MNLSDLGSVFRWRFKGALNDVDDVVCFGDDHFATLASFRLTGDTFGTIDNCNNNISNHIGNGHLPNGNGVVKYNGKTVETSYTNGVVNHGFIDVSLDKTDLPPKTEDAVIVSDVSFAYITIKSVSRKLKNLAIPKEARKPDSFPVLKHVSIRAPKGQIYTLLGASGCGKTTLLRCILGRLKPDRGEISVFGKVPTPGITVGYMPQEMALYEEFTVEQTLRYFGHLAHLTGESLLRRIEFLINLLHLPAKHRLVSALSGGQKRRLSLASALIHQPPLLILDEPTVGVDPVLRLSIWRYLRQLCEQSNVTVIITTHYVEEARAADVVGFMRFGQLLIEDNPETIITHFNAKSLEEVFLRLCATQDNKRALLNKQESIVSRRSAHNDHIEKADRKCFDMLRCKTIFWKNMFKMRRNVFALLLYCFLPTMQAILFCGLVGQDPKNMAMGIVNGEQPAQLSGIFLSMLDTNIISPVAMSDLDSARSGVKSGDLIGVITFQHNFSEALQERYLPDADEDVVSGSKIRLYMDMSNFVNAMSIYHSILRTFERFLEHVTAMSEMSGVSLPLKVEKYIYGDDHPSFARTHIPGMVLCLIVVSPLLMALFITVSERADGLLDRSLVLGVNGLEVIAAISATQLIMLFVPILLMLITFFWAFAMQNDGSFIHVFLLVYLQGVSAASMGLLISALFGDLVAAFILAILTVLPSWYMSGIMWPRSAMNEWVAPFAHIWSLTIPTDSLSCVILRGWGVEHFEVIAGYLSTTGFILVYFIPAIFLFKKFTNS